jgi:hypothetical protein
VGAALGMTSSLRQMTLVSCPTAQAAKRVEAFLAQNGVVNGHVARIPFGFDLMAPNGDGNVRVQHAIALDVAIDSKPGDLDATFNVEWKSSDGGPYPSFHGQLAIENEDYDSFWLELRGTYRPPFGLLGSVFDAVAGRRIAAQSAREFLAKMASSIEAAFQADEAAKPSPPVERLR